MKKQFPPPYHRQLLKVFNFIKINYNHFFELKKPKNCAQATFGTGGYLLKESKLSI